MKHLFLTMLLLSSFMFSSNFVAVAADADDPFVVIPDADENFGKDVKALGEVDPEECFRCKYNRIGDGYAQEKNGLGSQLASGIVTWDTILLLLVQVVKAIANAALVVGAAMVIYAGYLYVTAVYTGMESNTGKAKEAIKDAFIGIFIVIFSYAITRVMNYMFLT